jgi:peptidoglycan/xylan/chitin deacetylase (PgdA/CDA1 family)
MDERLTQTTRPDGSGSAQWTSPRVRGRSLEPHHRRRRAFALAALALLALLFGISAGSGGGGGAARAVHRPAGYFAQIRQLAGGGAGSLVASEQAAENAAIDRTLAYTPLVRVAGAQHREIALTFDDGPGPFTPRILSILEQQSVPATFFEVGVLERYFHDSTAEQVAHGFPIGDHTQSHAPMAKLPAGEQRAQILQQISATGNYGAPFPRLFRPPYGLWNQTTLRILQGFKMLMVMWTIDTEDYKRPGVQAIVSRVLAGATPGAIVLLHDAGGSREQTVEALPEIISGLRARGYKLVTVPRLLLDNPAPADQSLPPSLPGSGG